MNYTDYELEYVYYYLEYLFVQNRINQVSRYQK